MKLKITITLVLLLTASPALADGRTVAYLQGAAFGIAANCPGMPVDANAIAGIKHDRRSRGSNTIGTSPV
jgi:hypothetical protein